MKNKIFIALALVAMVLIGGCVASSGNGTDTGGLDNQGDANDTQTKVTVTHHGGTCRQNTDCLVVNCRNLEEKHCMNTVQVQVDLKCQEFGGVASEKNYDLCGCYDGVCRSK